MSIINPGNVTPAPAGQSVVTRTVNDLLGWLYDFIGFLGGVAGILKGAGASFISLATQASYLENPVTPLSPAEAATASVKNAVTPLNLAQEAAKSGYDADRFATLVNLTGNPPGPETLIEMVNRGIISADDMHRGLLQGFLKDEYVTPYFGLQFDLLTAQQYIEADVQNAPAGDEPWSVKAAQAGLQPSEYDTAYYITGNPPGPMQMIELMNRGYMTEAQVIQGLRESRLKDRYIPFVLQLANTQIPVRELIDAVKAGAVTKDVANKLFANLGYSGDLADILIKTGASVATTASKNLNISMIKGLYQDKVITHAQATADLAILGYSADDAALYLDLLDAQVTQRFLNLAMSTVHAGYKARKITAAQASTDLDSLGIAGPQRDQLLNLWYLELQASPKILTVGQLNSAYKKGLIDMPTFIARIEALGYDNADAQILAEIDVPPDTGSATVPTGAFANPTPTTISQLPATLPGSIATGEST